MDILGNVMIAIMLIMVILLYAEDYISEFLSVLAAARKKNISYGKFLKIMARAAKEEIQERKTTYIQETVSQYEIDCLESFILVFLFILLFSICKVRGMI